MRRTPTIVLSVALAFAALGAHGANTPDALDQPPSNVVPGTIDMTPQAGSRAERPLDPTGNPLWGIPLSTLTATRERPLFTPSRRAPAPAVAGPVAAAQPSAAPPPPAEPERPQLVLVGAIASETEGIAVFLDQTNNAIVRLKTGQDHSGWVLRSVKGREATLEKDQQTTTLVLPIPGAGPMAGGGSTGGEPVAPPMPGPPGPPTGRPAGGMLNVPMGAPRNPITNEPEL